jgi:hypothetical protein
VSSLLVFKNFVWIFFSYLFSFFSFSSTSFYDSQTCSNDVIGAIGMVDNFCYNISLSSSLNSVQFAWPNVSTFSSTDCAGIPTQSGNLQQLYPCSLDTTGSIIANLPDIPGVSNVQINAYYDYQFVSDSETGSFSSGSERMMTKMRFGSLLIFLFVVFFQLV